MTVFSLESPHLQLTCDSQAAAFHLESRAHPGAQLLGAQMLVRYRRQGRTHQALQVWAPASQGEMEVIDSLHGTATQRSLVIGPDSNGLALTLTFALPVQMPALLWKMRLENRGKAPLTIDRVTLLQTGFISTAPEARPAPGYRTGRLRLGAKTGQLGFFSNGWQSWAHSGSYSMFERFRRSRLGPFSNPMRVNAGTPQPGDTGHFASDMFAVLGDRTYRRGVLLGFLSQNQHFGSLEAYLDPFNPGLRLWANGDGARLDPGASQETDWAYLQFIHLDEPQPLSGYLQAVARQVGLDSPALRQPPPGWCSWYHYFQKISTEIIETNLQAAVDLRAELPLELFQIDDGFEAQVGDWFEFQPAFAQGVAPLARLIRARGFTPGLWLAPFIVHPDSKLARSHPDWLLRNRWGRPANAGFVWNRFTQALDLTHPEAAEYTRQVISTAVEQWGFPYLKLDFLYAAALPGRYQDATRTRAQVLRGALQDLRAAAGAETLLLGCGCPLGSAIGIMDAMRISADVSPDWHPVFNGQRWLFKAEPDMPCARNAIHNTLTRLPLHQQWWVNDPDCLLVRAESNLTLPEVHSLATAIALSGGLLLVSDDLAALSADRRRILASMLPGLPGAARAVDWFDQPTPTRLQFDLSGAAGKWQLLTLFNWADQPASLQLQPAEFQLPPAKTYLARNFWDGTHYTINEAGLVFENIPAHGCLLLAVRPFKHGPLYLGSDLHISQGLEISRWQLEDNGVRLGLQRPALSTGSLDLLLPAEPQRASLDGTPVAWQAVGEQVYRFAVSFDQHAELEVGW